MEALQRRSAGANGVAARQDIDVSGLDGRVVVSITTTATASTSIETFRHVVLPQLRVVRKV